MSVPILFSLRTLQKNLAGAMCNSVPDKKSQIGLKRVIPFVNLGEKVLNRTSTVFVLGRNLWPCILCIYMCKEDYISVHCMGAMRGGKNSFLFQFEGFLLNCRKQSTEAITPFISSVQMLCLYNVSCLCLSLDQ